MLSNTSYSFYYEKEIISSKKEFICKISESINTEYIIFHDSNVIVPINQILEGIELLRKNTQLFVYPYDGRVGNVDVLTKNIFFRIIEPGLLLQNIGKTVMKPIKYLGGILLYKKNRLGSLSQTVDMPIELIIENVNEDDGLIDLIRQDRIRVPGILFKI